MSQSRAPDNHRNSAQASANAAIAAEERASRNFGEWLDCELQRLVAQWSHLAAPAATRPPRVKRRPK